MTCSKGRQANAYVVFLSATKHSRDNGAVLRETSRGRHDGQPGDLRAIYYCWWVIKWLYDEQPEDLRVIYYCRWVIMDKRRTMCDILVSVSELAGFMMNNQEAYVSYV